MVPVIGGAAQSIVDAGENIRARKAAGEPPALASINGISDVLRPPLSGPNDRAALGGMGLLLIAGVGVLIVVLLVRK